MENSYSVVLSESQRVGHIPLVSVMWSVLRPAVRGGDSWAGFSVQLLLGSGMEKMDAAGTQEGAGDNRR